MISESQLTYKDFAVWENNNLNNDTFINSVSSNYDNKFYVLESVERIPFDFSFSNIKISLARATSYF